MSTGIGIPMMASNYLTDITVTLQSENGILGLVSQLIKASGDLNEIRFVKHQKFLGQLYTKSRNLTSRAWLRLSGSAKQLAISCCC